MISQESWLLIIQLAMNPLIESDMILPGFRKLEFMKSFQNLVNHQNHLQNFTKKWISCSESLFSEFGSKPGNWILASFQITPLFTKLRTLWAKMLKTLSVVMMASELGCTLALGSPYWREAAWRPADVCALWVVMTLPTCWRLGLFLNSSWKMPFMKVIKFFFAPE